MDPFCRAIDILNRSELPYVIIGGFAIVMHGNNRFTPDLNVVCDLDHQSSLTCRNLLLENGFTTLSDQSADALTSAELRQQEVDNKRHMLTFVDPQYPTFKIEFLLTPLIPFSDLKADCQWVEISNGLNAPICGRKTLRQLKESAGRGQDKDDLEALALVEQLIGKTPDEQRHIIASLDSDADRDRAQALQSFMRLSPTERREWLCEMLTELGQFCIL